MPLNRIIRGKRIRFNKTTAAAASGVPDLGLPWLLVRGQAREQEARIFGAARLATLSITRSRKKGRNF